MKYTSLHKIVTGYLLQRRYPIHFYVEFLMYSKRCLEELSYDSLGNIRAVKLPINDEGRVTLPCDYIDWCKVGVPVGQYVRPLYPREGMTRLSNFDDSGEKIAYPSTDNVSFDSVLGYFGYYGWQTRFNEKLENNGRMYGSRGNNSGSFTIVKEDNEIEINTDLDATEIILEYISDGQEADNATQITPYAISSVEAFIKWKMRENGRSYSESEIANAKNDFNKEHKKLRARLSDVTIDGIKAIVNRNTHGAPK